MAGHRKHPYQRQKHLLWARKRRPRTHDRDDVLAEHRAALAKLGTKKPETDQMMGGEPGVEPGHTAFSNICKFSSLVAQTVFAMVVG